MSPRLIVRGVALSALLAVGACADTDTTQPVPSAATTAAAPQRPASDDRYIVTYRDGAGRSAALAEGQLALDLGSRNMVATRLSPAAVDKLRGRADIASVELDARRYPMAETIPYGVTMVQADQVPATPASGDPLVTVCIIDSGLRASHEDFAGLPVNGSSDSGSGAWNNDTCGHGTHVAGTVAAMANDVGVVGVAPGAVSLYIVKVFDGADCGWSYSSTLVAALDECRNHGAKVVSMSLGGSLRSKAEDNAFKSAWNAGVISVAAAGNDGNNRNSYPASYANVVSVAAIDQNKVVASFSQHNANVDLAAPGVGVRSTYVYRDSLTVGGVTYYGAGIEGAALGSVDGTLVAGGLCDSVGSWSGKVVLCERGNISFADKVANAQSGGAVGVAIYNNVPGGFAGTLGTGVTSPLVAISLSQEDGQTIAASSLGLSANVYSNYGDGYAELDGTSMATPHVSAVTALVWAQFPNKSNQEIVDALTATAEDLGAPGRDDYYGYGLVQAGAAYDLLSSGGSGPDCSADGVCNALCTSDPDCGGVCLPKGDSCNSGGDCCSGSCGGKPGSRTCK